MKDWPGVKPMMPNQSMPTIEFPNGLRMGQTCAIARYIANMYGIHPTDAMEAWVNDAWMEDFNESIVI